jgi:carboxymethylenebutenolidase
MDGLGIRPPLVEMGARLARTGYIVLVPDLYYRAGAYGPFDPKEVFAARENFGTIMGRVYGTTDNRRAAQDAASFLAYLDTRSDIAGKKIGTFGYCMGGAIALTIAGTYPDRVAAAASFHGGSLAIDSELSPHLLASKIKARIYIGVADKDEYYPPEMHARFEKALMDGGVHFLSEFYPGALHGWTQTDFPLYHEAAAERHWRALIDLFDETLKGPR